MPRCPVGRPAPPTPSPSEAIRVQRSPGTKGLACSQQEFRKTQRPGTTSGQISKPITATLSHQVLPAETAWAQVVWGLRTPNSGSHLPHSRWGLVPALLSRDLGPHGLPVRLGKLGIAVMDPGQTLTW